MIWKAGLPYRDKVHDRKTQVHISIEMLSH